MHTNSPDRDHKPSDMDNLVSELLNENQRILKDDKLLKKSGRYLCYS